MILTIHSLLQGINWNKKIEILRVAKGWSQEEAAERCGTTLKTYWLWESGNTYPHRNNRKAIAAAFGIQYSEIFADEGRKTNACK